VSSQDFGNDAWGYVTSKYHKLGIALLISNQ